MANRPIAIHSPLTATEGYAVWYHALISSKMPPTMLSTRKEVAVPESRPIETSAYGTRTETAPIQPRPSTKRREDKKRREGK